MWCGDWGWSRSELLYDVCSISEDFHRACGVRVMKCGDCVMVWKNSCITSGYEMLEVDGEIFGMVAGVVFRCAKSVRLIRVRTATGG